MSPWLQVTVQATQISMSPLGSSALRHAHGSQWQLRPQTSAWPLVVTWDTDTNTDPSCSRTRDPDLALGDSLTQDLNMASSYLPDPHCHRASSSTLLHSVLHFLFLPCAPFFSSFNHIFAHHSGIPWQVLECLSSGCPQ